MAPFASFFKNIISAMFRFVFLLWRERPHLLNNPIVIRELVMQLRKKSSFFYLFLCLGVSSLCLVIGWHIFVRNLSYYHLHNSYYSHNLLLIISVVQGFVFLLFVPLLSATAISLETERETWDLLRTSPISLSSIILGKFLSALLFVWMILISMIPVVAMTMPMGGVSPKELLMIFIMFTEGLAIVSLIGLFCSIRWKRTIQSISFTYVFCLLYFLGLPIGSVFLSSAFQNFYLGISGILFSPVFPFTFTYLLEPNFLSSRIGVQNPLFLHFVLIVLVMGFLLFLSVWQMMPQTKSRFEEFCQRFLLSLGEKVGKPLFLIATSWMVIFVIQAVLDLSTKRWFWQWINLSDPSEQKFFFLQIIYLIELGVLLLFPFITTMYYQNLWNRQPWDELASAPSNLVHFLFRTLKHPFKVYGLWILGMSPGFLLLYLYGSNLLQIGLWVVSIDVLTVFCISLISLACSLMTRGAWQSIVHAYTISGFFLIFIPWCLSRLKLNFYPTISPFFFTPYFILRDSKNMWQRPFEAFWFNPELWGTLANLLIAMLILMVAVFLFSEWRVLKLAGRFERESVWNWLIRTLMNRAPKIQRTPRKEYIPFFPEKGNPVAVRELREYFLNRRAGLFKNLLWLILGSIIIMWVPLTDLFYNKYSQSMNSLLLILVILPLFIVPFAANSFRREHDQSTWDLLSTTTLSPRQFLHGKLLSGIGLFHVRFLAFLLPTLAMFVLLTTFVENYRHIWNGFIQFLIVVYPFLLLIAMVSTYFSVRISKTTSAYILSLLFPYIILGVLPFLIEILFESRLITNPTSTMLGSYVSPFCLLAMYGISDPPAWWYGVRNGQILTFLVLSGLFYVGSLYVIRRETFQE